ncbi:hypothetical protein Avbf_02288 [Armadillidium vulgare]|nr:hypothetical protein Avbf_02288 [Armadillidium vulgare]
MYVCAKSYLKFYLIFESNNVFLIIFCSRNVVREKIAVFVNLCKHRLYRIENEERNLERNSYKTSYFDLILEINICLQLKMNYFILHFFALVFASTSANGEVNTQTRDDKQLQALMKVSIYII